jgi:hypothetical protein
MPDLPVSPSSEASQVNGRDRVIGTNNSTDSARGSETTGINRHQPDKWHSRSGRPASRYTYGSLPVEQAVERTSGLDVPEQLSVQGCGQAVVDDRDGAGQQDDRRHQRQGWCRRRRYR